MNFSCEYLKIEEAVKEERRPSRKKVHQGYLFLEEPYWLFNQKDFIVIQVGIPRHH